MLLTDVGYLGFLGYVFGSFGITAIPAGGSEIAFSVLSTVAQGFDVVALPVFPSRYAALTQMAITAKMVKNPKPDTRWRSLVICLSNPFFYGPHLFRSW